MVKYLLIVALFSITLNADSGCNIFQKTSCEDSNFLTQKKDSPKSLVDSTYNPSYINITENLQSVDVVHLDNNITIERSASKSAPLCPPYCIEPMKIKGVETVGELELLEFVKKLNKKRDGLLIDVRKNSKYRDETIPSAINLPYDMLTKASPYQKEVLKTLGAKKIRNGWFFKNPQKLMIFGESSFSPEASKAVKELLKLGYPKDKILYYRGGILSWKDARLTLF